MTFSGFALACCLAAPAFGQQAGDQTGDPAAHQGSAQQQQQQQQRMQEKPQRQGQQTAPQESPASGSRQVSGEVQGLRTIRLEGEPEPHVLAKVRLPGGEMRVLDLGPESNLRQQQRSFQRGQNVRAQGREGKINDVAVLVVDRIEGDGIVTVIPVRTSSSRDGGSGGQSASARQQSDQQKQTSQQKSGEHSEMRQAHRRAAGRSIVGGHVAEVKQTRIRESGAMHRVVKIRTGRDRTVIADLGPQGAGDLELKPGDPILVQGRVGRINGKPAVFAQQVAEIARIDRAQQERRDARATTSGGAASRGAGGEPSEPSGASPAPGARSGDSRAAP